MFDKPRALTGEQLIGIDRAWSNTRLAVGIRFAVSAHPRWLRSNWSRHWRNRDGLWEDSNTTCYWSASHRIRIVWTCMSDYCQDYITNEHSNQVIPITVAFICCNDLWFSCVKSFAHTQQCTKNSQKATYQDANKKRLIRPPFSGKYICNCQDGKY